MTTTPKPPRGRRWLEPDEFVRKGDWFHASSIHSLDGRHARTLFPLTRVPVGAFYSRKLRTKTRK